MRSYVSGKTVEDKMKTVLVLDARSYTAAVANRAKGGGCECAEYYPNCDIQFMGLANIHAIRKSFQAMRQLCASPSDQASWLSALENTRWLHNISALIKSALLVVDAVDRKGQPVIVHCSDGWDRTPQIVALGELMMDSFYRTIEGFQVLVEREWLEFGHKFGDRCGHNLNTDDANERCPVFLQFLDCVHQLQLQFPCAFEFNEAYLVKLIQHTYSCLFGTFLCNSSKARHHHRIHKRTFSTWTFLRSTRKRFCNLLYAHSDQVLKPVSSIQKLEFWATVYLADHASGTPDDRAAAAAAAAAETTLPPTMATLLLTKTRSCDDIVAVLEQQQQQHALTRTSSDPNLAEMHRGFLPSGGAPSSAAATTMPDPSAGTALNNGCGGGLENGCGRQECVPAASCVDEAEMTNGAVTMYENHVNDGEGDRDATNESVEEREDVEQQEEEEEEEGEEGREKAEKNCIAFNTKSRSERVEPWNGRPSAVEQSVESSTDTLVQDPTTLAVTADSDTYVSPACCSNGVTSSATFDSPPCCANGVAANDVVVVKSFDEKFKRSSLGLTVNTDCGGGGGSAAPAARDGQATTQQVARPCRTAHASGSSVTSAESSPNQWTTATLAAATTPGSSYPTSPVMVALDPLLHRSMSGLLRQLDHDGLPVVRDPVQQQLRRQQAEYMARIDALQRELHETQNLLIRQMCRQCCQYATNAVDYYDESVKADHL
ncbi:PREDICTED: myotubularin-related protein 3-like isoform X2 [Priapulus caudatus]|uniref:Myotubularin-related protein 3-like isoform X2 n=1 Tax=Priapulus caudatus TaxID=37621 RepID=A0ABM1DVN6_PRICU|nr:PREDICTED: myotubularin-related protein 3-like isoform X2 [Priapulus caudatus]